MWRSTTASGAVAAKMPDRARRVNVSLASSPALRDTPCGPSPWRWPSSTYLAGSTTGFDAAEASSGWVDLVQPEVSRASVSTATECLRSSVIALGGKVPVGSRRWSPTAWRCTFGPIGHVRSTAEMGYRRLAVTDNVYTFTEVVGTSAESWEKAAATAVERAAKTLRDLRVAEVVKLDMELEGGQVRAYRARVQISFKLEDPS
jgi:dodecin